MVLQEQVLVVWHVRREVRRAIFVENFFSTVCRKMREHRRAVVKSIEDEEASMNKLISYIIFDQKKGTFVSTDGDQETEINASVIPSSPKPDPRRAANIPSSRGTTLKVFPDKCAVICLGEPKHLFTIGLTKDNLVPSRKIIRTLGGFTLVCQGWLPVKFMVRGKKTKQALDICRDIQRLYRAACIDVGILYKKFPMLLSRRTCRGRPQI